MPPPCVACVLAAGACVHKEGRAQAGLFRTSGLHARQVRGSVCEGWGGVGHRGGRGGHHSKQTIPNALSWQ